MHKLDFNLFYGPRLSRARATTETETTLGDARKIPLSFWCFLINLHRRTIYDDERWDVLGFYNPIDGFSLGNFIFWREKWEHFGETLFKVLSWMFACVPQ